MDVAPKTWRLVVQYDGTAFAGFQRQAGHMTVQQQLEEGLRQLFGGESIVVHGSGRTDAGVHALGQVVSFRARATREPDRVRLGLNTILPPALSCVDAAIVDESFHARFSARGKTYRYVILHRRDRSPFHIGRAWHLRVAIDWDAVDRGLAALVGEHDFNAFRGAKCTTRTSIRTIWRAERSVHGDETHLEFEGNGFLRYQVRRMVGTLIEVGRGRRAWTDIPALLASGQREDTGKTAPPEGLYLVRAWYGDVPA